MPSADPMRVDILSGIPIFVTFNIQAQKSIADSTGLLSDLGNIIMDYYELRNKEAYNSKNVSII